MIPNNILAKLTAAIDPHAQLIPRGHDAFLQRVRVFNGVIKSNALLVARPVFANDVGQILLWAQQNNYSVSVKSGGFDIAGWSVKGDVVIDMSLMDSVSLEPPLSVSDDTNIDYTHLRTNSEYDPAASKKGKGKGVGPVSVSSTSSLAGAKRTIDQESSDPTIALASKRKLEDKPISEDDLLFDVLKPRVALPSTQPEPEPVIPAPKVSNDAEAVAGSGGGSGDPFGYLDDPIDAPPQPSPDLSFLPPSIQRAMASSVGSSSQSGSSETISPPVVTQTTTTTSVHEEDTAPPHAYLTVGIGANQTAIMAYCNANPISGKTYFAVFPSHPVGLGSLLLTGMGPLSRLHGLAVDNIVEVELVTHDGKIVHASEKENSDLFWGMRGAGTMFGVVTRVKMRVWPVGRIWAGNLIYNFHPATAPSLLTHIRDVLKYAPPSLYALILISAGPTGSKPIVIVQLIYFGERARGISADQGEVARRGRELVEMIKAWDGEGCVLDDVRERDYLEISESVKHLIGGVQGRKWFIRSELITSLTDELISNTVMKFGGTPVGCSWFFELLGGEIQRPEGSDDCIPKKNREAMWNVVTFHQWGELEEVRLTTQEGPRYYDNEEDEECIRSAEAWLNEDLKPLSVGGPFPAFLTLYEDHDRIYGAYGSSDPTEGNWARLMKMKKEWDPKGMFKNGITEAGAA